METKDRPISFDTSSIVQSGKDAVALENGDFAIQCNAPWRPTTFVATPGSWSLRL
jgi:hypothetical protein